MLKYVIGVSLALFVFAGVFADDLPVTQQCLGCICEGISACNTTSVCSGDVCGPFRITWAYWADAGKPCIRGETPESPQAYPHCAGDTYCAALAVQGYMSKFQQDCNGDGKIDCDDYASIHVFGAYGCHGTHPEPFGSRYRQCKRIVGGH